MPFRPEQNFRRDIHWVIYPLTEAVSRLYGRRNSDGAYPIGAFYPINITNKSWRHADGIWYIPLSEDKLDSRKIKEDVVEEYMRSIYSGSPVTLSNGKVVVWESIPVDEAQALPRAR